MMKGLPATLFVILLFSGVCCLAVATSPMSRAVACLAASQSSAGTWSAAEATTLLDTYAAVLALRHCSGVQAEATLWRGAAGLLQVQAQAQAPGWEGNLLSALATAVAGGSVSPDDLRPWHSSSLLGWSQELGAAPDLLATLMTLELAVCLLDIDTLRGCSAWQEGARFLCRAQAADGWWRFSPWPAPGDFRLSCRVAAILARFDWSDVAESPVLTVPLSEFGARVKAWLLANGWLGQAGAGSAFHGELGSVYDAAVAMQLLCRLGQWEDAVAVGQKLQEQQNHDGGWSESHDQHSDIQTTAAVMMALASLRLTTPETWPDLMVVADGVDCQCDYDTGLLTVKALVFNQGTAAADAFKVTFYHTWPTEGNLLQQWDVPRLVAGSSDLVSLQLDFSVLPPVFVVVADAEGAVPDLQRGNNVCFCYLKDTGDDWSPTDASELAILPPGLLINGQMPAELLFLAPGTGVRLAAHLLATGGVSAVQYEFSSNGQVIASGSQAITEVTGAVVSADWYPMAGEHMLRLHVKAAEATAAGEAMTSWQTTVVAEGAWLRTWRQMENGWQPEINFPAREYVEIEAKCADHEAAAQIWVESLAGEHLGQATPAFARQGRWHWHTGTLPPGEYVVKGKFWHSLTGALLAEAMTSFQIVPTAEFSALSLSHSLPGSVLPCGQELSFFVRLQWQSIANLWPLTGYATCHWEREDGVIVSECEEASVHFPLDRSSLSQHYEMPLQVSFLTPGVYALILCLHLGDFVLQDQLRLQAVAQSLPTVENEVVPPLFDAAGTLLTTRIKVQLPTATDTNSDHAPAKFALGEFSPFVADDNSGGLLIPLQEICDARGVLIAEDNLISIVEYGRCVGEADLAPARCFGSVSLHHVRHGAAQLHYTPVGGILKGGQWATVVIALYQVRQCEDSWLIKRRIGEVELFLEGK